MLRKTLLLISILIFSKIKTEGQSVSILVSDKIINFKDLIDINIQKDSLSSDSCFIEVSLFSAGNLRFWGKTNNIDISTFKLGHLYYTDHNFKDKNLEIAFKENLNLPKGVYKVQYRLLYSYTNEDITDTNFMLTITGFTFSNKFKEGISGVTKPSLISLPDSLVPAKKYVLKFIDPKKIKTSGWISANYNYGIQQFNPQQTKPTGYFLYNGNSKISYGILPVDVSFQYTAYKEYYGIPKYFRVSFDTRQFKQNILEKGALQKKNIQDSLFAVNKEKQKTEKDIAFLKSKLDTSKIIKNEKLLNEAEEESKKLLEDEKQKSEEYLLMKKDTMISSELVSDSLHNDSLNQLKQELDDLQSKRKKIEEEKLRYERIKHEYDSTSLQLSKYEEKYTKLKIRTDTLQKLNNLNVDPDSLVKSYLMGKIPHPKNKLGNGVVKGFTGFIMGVKTLEVGMCNPNYSPFLINGTPLKGINMEWGNKEIFFGITYGKTIVNPLANLQRNQYNPLLAVKNIYNYYDFNNDTLTRKVFATKLGIGKEDGNHIYLGYLNGTGSSAIANDSSIHHKKERNGVNEIGAQLKVGKNNILTFNYAKSSLLKLQNFEDASLAQTIEQIYKQQNNGSAQLQCNSYLRKTNTFITATVRLVQPYFESFGVSFLNADNIRYEIQVKQSLTNRIKLILNYRYFQDNLLWLFNQRNLIQTAGLTLQCKISKDITATLMVSPATVNKKSEKSIIEHSNLFNNNSLISTALIQYKKKKFQFNMGDNYYRFNYDTSQSFYNQASISYIVIINKKSQWQNELMHFYTSDRDTLINSSVILQTCVKTKIKKTTTQILLRGSYNNNDGIDYGYELKFNYPLTKNMLAEITTSKYVRGNFLSGFNDSILKRYPYQTIIKLIYKW